MSIRPFAGASLSSDQCVVPEAEIWHNLSPLSCLIFRIIEFIWFSAVKNIYGYINMNAFLSVS